MQWRFQKLNYDILIPKLDKSIFKLNKKETESYFEWFMEQVPKRVTYVSQVCAKELRLPIERMDCSPESLLLLWKWFRKKAKTEPVKLSEEEKNHPAYANGMFRNKHQLTLETEYIIRDIGMYLGETFRNGNAAIYWTYYTEPHNDFFVNCPLLKGFVDRTFGDPSPVCFEPIHMAGVQAAKILDRTSKDVDLLNLYNLWAQKIPQEGDGSPTSPETKPTDPK